MTIDEMKEERKRLWKALRSSAVILHRTKKLLTLVEERYLKDKSRYEKCDYELALVDGRAQKLTEVQAKSSEKKKKESLPDLTEEQIMHICAELGIELP